MSIRTRYTVVVLTHRTDPGARPRAIVFVHEKDAHDYVRDNNGGQSDEYAWLLDAPVYTAW
jgi:hypothetical protein